MRDKYAIIVLFAVATLISITLSKYKSIAAASIESSKATSEMVRIRDSFEVAKLDRVETLKQFFGEYNSPLKDHSEKFVEIADKYDMDYRLLPSIACMESTCGKKIIPGTFNPFGWGIYGGKYIAFKSWDEGIEIVAKGLKDNYLSKGLDTPAKIAPIYTPPRPWHWLNGVSFFYQKITQVSEQS